MLTRILLAAYCLVIPGIESLRVLVAIGIPPLDRILFVIFALIWSAAALTALLAKMRLLRTTLFLAIAYSIAIDVAYLFARFDLLHVGTSLRTVAGCLFAGLLYRHMRLEVLA